MTGRAARGSSAKKMLGRKAPAKTASAKREVWRVASGGKVRNIATSVSTSQVMDQAVVKYRNALRRLADQ